MTLYHKWICIPGKFEKNIKIEYKNVDKIEKDNVTKCVVFLDYEEEKFEPSGI